MANIETIMNQLGEVLGAADPDNAENVLNKLQLHNRVELTRYAIERGLDADD